jgi:hypothetical protein
MNCFLFWFRTWMKRSCCRIDVSAGSSEKDSRRRGSRNVSQMRQNLTEANGQHFFDQSWILCKPFEQSICIAKSLSTCISFLWFTLNINFRLCLTEHFVWALWAFFLRERAELWFAPPGNSELMSLSEKYILKGYGIIILQK